MGRSVIIVLLAFITAGCVSNSTYKKAVDESAVTKQSLESTRAELSQARQDIENVKRSAAEDKAAREKEVGAIKTQYDELSKRSSETESDLKKEIDRLKVKTGEVSSEKEKELANLKTSYEDLLKEMKSEIAKGEVKITQAVDRLSVNLVDKILFDSGEVEVKPEGLQVLKRVGDILKVFKDKQIRVEGHTDNVKLGGRMKKQYPTNWELSAARAANVVRYLQDEVGIDPKILSVTGYSQYKPVGTNDTMEGRAQNRRIEIVLLPLDTEKVLEELKN